jgi:hypothetical protein
MKIKSSISRRTFLAGSAAAAGALAFSRPGLKGGWFKKAHAQAAEKPALLIVFLQGGYNALFCSADSFQAGGTFGVNAGNVLDLGNGLRVDQPTFGTMPALARTHMATIGVRHGSSSHGQARMLDWYVNNQAVHLNLAAAIGGDAAIKAANVGQARPDGNNAAVAGVSLQTITDMSATIAALGGVNDPRVPARAIAAPSLIAARTMSQSVLAGSQKSLVTVSEGYDASIATLQKPVQPFSFPTLAAAYGLAANATAVNSFTQKMAAAELMITAGANVVTAVDGGWDSHGDRDGARVRNMMNQRILPGLNAFLGRMLADPTRNVVTVIMGDFSRSLPGSDHQPNLSVTVIGKYVKVGTTGKVAANVSLPAGTPSVPGLWAYVAKALKITAEPFGANPHDLIL